MGRALGAQGRAGGGGPRMDVFPGSPAGTAPPPPSLGHHPPGVSGPSPEPRACDVKLDQPYVLEVRGAGDPLVGDHGCQEGLLL